MLPDTTVHYASPPWLTRVRWPLLAFAALLPGLLALSGPFFYCDDYTNIHKSPLVTGARPLWSAFVKPYFNHYAPLHEVLIWLQWQVFGGKNAAGELVANPLGFRVVSLLLHFGAAAALWQMLRRLTRREGLALGVALLWAAHPANCDAVAWIVEQKTLACGLFAFWALAVWFDDRRSTAARVALSATLMLIGGLFKAHALVVAPLALLYEVFRRHESGSARLTRILATLPLCVIAGALAAAALWANRPMDQAVEWRFADFLLHLPASLLIYLKVAFVPWTASSFHDLERLTSPGDAAFWGVALILVAITAVVLALVEKPARRAAGFFCLSYVAAIGPMLNISAWSFPAYDRYQYLALPFALVAIALVGEGLLARRTGRETGALPGVVLWGVPLAVVGLMALMRGGLYADELELAKHAVRHAPRNAWAHAAFANTMIGRSIDARKAGNEVEQRAYASAIPLAVDAARNCSNFRELFPTPVALLVSAAQIEIEGDPAAAVRHVRAALDEPKWKRFEKELAEARRLLPEALLRTADCALIAAHRSGVSAEAAARACVEALDAIAQAREAARALPPEIDRASGEETVAWLEFVARKRLAALQPERRAEHVEAARACLQKLPESSPYYPQALKELPALEQASP